MPTRFVSFYRVGCAMLGVCMLWTCCRAGVTTTRFLAFATWDKAFMAIGKYEPDKGWRSYQKFYEPPQPQDVFTIYTMAGEVAHAIDVDANRPNPWGTALEWTARLSPWYSGKGEPYGLAVLGESPLAAEPARELPKDSPELVTAVSSYLKKRGLDVPYPFITQAYEVSLAKDQPPAVLLAAHSDESALREDQAASVYALVLLRWQKNGAWVDIPVEQQTSYKSSTQSLEDHEKYNGTRDFLRLLACVDIDGNGWKEIVVYRAIQSFGTQVEVFTFDGRRLRKVITAFKHLANGL